MLQQVAHIGLAHRKQAANSRSLARFGGQAYDSLSTAAGMARKSVIGAPQSRPYLQTNGWQFWQYRDEQGDLQELDYLRKCYLALMREATA